MRENIHWRTLNIPYREKSFDTDYSETNKDVSNETLENDAISDDSVDDIDLKTLKNELQKLKSGDAFLSI